MSIFLSFCKGKYENFVKWLIFVFKLNSLSTGSILNSFEHSGLIFLDKGLTFLDKAKDHDNA